MKSRSLRLSALAVAGVATAALLSACGGSGANSSGGASGAIQVQTGFASGSPLLTTLTSLANDYQQKHPGVTFNLIPSTPNYEQTIKVDLASHNAPDIWMTHGWSRDRYGQFLTPLQDQSWNKDVNPALDAAMRGPNGEIYALPFDTDVSGIVYNKDVLAKAGIDPAKLTTWEAFDQAASAIKAMGVTPIEVSEKANGPAGNLIDWEAPGILSSDQLTALKNGKFESSTYQPLLDQIAKWQKSGFINPDYTSATQDDMSKALASSQAAFVFQQNKVATQAFTYNPKASLGFLPIPSNTGNPYLLGGEMDAMGVSKASSHQKDAVDFLNFLAQPENETQLAKAAGGIPGLKTAQASPSTVLDSYKQWVEQAKTPLKPYFDRVYLPNGLWNTLVTTTDSVITGQASPESATGQVGAQFSSLYGKNS